MPKRPAHAAAICLIVAAQTAIWWRAMHWYPLLPERFPIHFNIRGDPDGWSTKGAMWFALPIVSLVLLALLAGVTLLIDRLARRSPTLVNMPNKELFLRLSEQGRSDAVRPARTLLLSIDAIVMLVFAFIIEGTGRVAVGQMATLPSWPILVLLGVIFTCVIGFMLATTRSIDRIARSEGLLPPRQR